MASISLVERELITRLNELYAMFVPLRKGKDRVAIRFANDSPSGVKVLVATDDRNGHLQHRDASFRTSVSFLRCRYFELWRVAKGKNYILDRAYFTLLHVKAPDAFDEVLCLHTDPADAEVLKQGPHLHVTCAEDPIPHCHFPLEQGSLKTVLQDCDSLTSAMERAIGVVATDVLPRFPK